MTFPESERVVYRRNPLVEVIAELRFPPILRIEAAPPAEFQERIRGDYPELREESTLELDIPAEVPEQLRRMVSGAFAQMGRGDGSLAYRFVSEDGAWTSMLRRNSLALSAARYRHWGDFLPRLEVLLDALIAEYEVASFTRVGLRYRDLIVRSRLGLVDTPWSELLQPHVMGELATEALSGVPVTAARRILEVDLGDGLHLKLQHGTAKTPETGEEHAYGIDADFSKEGKTNGADAIDALVRANQEAGRLFRWCITPRLHAALEPEAVGSG